MDNEKIKNEDVESEQDTVAAEPAEEEKATLEAVETDEPIEAADTAETAEAVETVEAEAAYGDGAHNGGIEMVDAVEPETDKKGPDKRIIAVAGGAVVIVAAVIILFVSGVFNIPAHNDYNKNYLDVTGQTAGEMADEFGLSYKEFLDYFDLPSDMPEDTNANAAQNHIPAGRYAEMVLGMEFEDVKEQLQWDDSITEKTAWGEALDKTTLRNYIGEEQFDQFKSMYGIGDDITLDNTWGDIRPTFEQVLKTQYDDQKKQEEEAAEEAEKADEEAEKADEDGDNGEEAPAEEAPADAEANPAE